MKIFQVCNKSPFPPYEGGPIAMNNITQGLLKAGHDVKILAANTPKYHININEIPDDYLKKTSFESAYIDNRIKIYKAFMNLFTNVSYHVERFISKDFDDKIIHILKSNKFDIVQLESIYVASYIETIRKYSNAKIVLRSHNIEHLIWNRLAMSSSNPLKKIYLKYLSDALKDFEYKILKEVDGIAAITQHDADYFKQLSGGKQIISIPVGIEVDKIKNTNIKREFPGLFHLGSMDWMPNQEGIRWFVENVWDKVIKEFPSMTLTLAGRNMPDWLKKKNLKGVILQGEITNAFEYMQSRTVMLVPLLSGSGMRVKIIQGMACGNVIISTSIGAEGIHYTDGENILIADKPEEFVEQIKKCIDNPSLCENISKQAKKLVSEEYDNDVITKRLIQFYNELLHNNA